MDNFLFIQKIKLLGHLDFKKITNKIPARDTPKEDDPANQYWYQVQARGLIWVSF